MIKHNALMKHVRVTGNASDWVANVDLEWVYTQETGLITPSTSYHIAEFLRNNGAGRAQPCRAKSKKTGKTSVHRGMSGVRLADPDQVVWERLRDPADSNSLLEDLRKRRDA